MTFKEKLVILRKTRGITQDEFASAVGVSRQAVYKWECGQSYPEVPKLLEIKLLFGISIDNLLDDTFEISLPEKKKRKRLSKETMRRIEESVENTDTVATERVEEIVKAVSEPAPATVPAVEEAVYEAPVEEPEEMTVEVIVEEEVIEEPALVAAEVEAEAASESAAPEAVEEAAPAEAPAEEPAPAKEAPAAPEKKKGFFGRLFGKK